MPFLCLVSLFRLKLKTRVLLLCPLPNPNFGEGGSRGRKEKVQLFWARMKLGTVQGQNGGDRDRKKVADQKSVREEPGRQEPDVWPQRCWEDFVLYFKHSREPRGGGF